MEDTFKSIGDTDSFSNLCSERQKLTSLGVLSICQNLLARLASLQMQWISSAKLTELLLTNLFIFQELVWQETALSSAALVQIQKNYCKLKLLQVRGNCLDF